MLAGSTLLLKLDHDKPCLLVATPEMAYSWVSLGYFAVNLSGGQPKMY